MNINHKVFLTSLYQFGLLWSTSFSSLQLELNTTVKNLSVVASQISVSKH